MSDADPAITKLLHSWRAGSQSAQNELLPLVYERLRKLAASYLRGERAGHTLAPTALVHEAYLKIAGSEVEWNDRGHFFSVAAIAMRRILVDYAKQRNRKRRGGGAVRADLTEALVISHQPDPAILDLDEALNRLAKMDERKVRIVELVFFGGLSQKEAAEVLGISDATVSRELRMANAWIKNELQSVNASGSDASTTAAAGE